METGTGTFRLGKLIGLMLGLRGLLQMGAGESLQFLAVPFALPELLWACNVFFQTASPGRKVPEDILWSYRAYKKIFLFQGLSFLIPLLFTAGLNPYHHFFSNASYGAFLVGMGLYYFFLNGHLENASDTAADSPKEFCENARNDLQRVCWLLGFLLFLNNGLNLDTPVLEWRIDARQQVTGNLQRGILKSTLGQNLERPDGYLQQRVSVTEPTFDDSSEAAANPLYQLAFFKFQSGYLFLLFLCLVFALFKRPHLVALANTLAAGLLLSLAIQATGAGKDASQVQLQTGFFIGVLAHVFLFVPAIPKIDTITFPVLQAIRHSCSLASPGKAATVLTVASLIGWAGVDYLTRDPVTVLINAARSGSAEKMERNIDWFKRLPYDQGLVSRLYQEALRENQDNLIELLIKKGVPFNLKGTWVEPPLYWAAVWRHHHAATMLLENGADPNLPNGYFSSTPLQGVAEMGANAADVELVGLLLAKGAKLEGTDSRGRTPLISAIEQGNTFMTKELLRRGARFNGEIEGKSLLQYAINRNQKEIIDLLMKAGATDIATPSGNLSEITTAIQKGNVELTKTLIAKGAKVDQPTEEGTSPLYQAILKDDLETISLLLKSGADPNRKSGPEQKTPLHLLAELSSGKTRAMAEILLNNRADPSVLNKDLQTPLQIAVFQGKSDLVQLFLEHGAKADQRFEKPRGDTLLHLAVLDGNLEMAQNLMAHGAVIDAANLEGDTPLHLAVRGKTSGIVSVLLAKGADPKALNQKKETPRDLAVQAGLENLFTATGK